MDEHGVASKREDRVRITLEPVALAAGDGQPDDEQALLARAVDEAMSPAMGSMAPSALPRMPSQRTATSPMAQVASPEQATPPAQPAERTPLEWIGAYIEGRDLVRLPVSVVIPTWNDAETIGAVVSQLSEVEQLVVVDSGSSDRTVEIVREHRPDALVVSHRSSGPGSSVRAGLMATTATYLVCMAADEDVDAAEIHRIISMVDSGQGVVAGSRRRVEGLAAGPNAARGSHGRALVGFCNLLLGTNLADTPFGYLAMGREVAAELGLCRISEPAMAPTAQQESDERPATSRWLRRR